MEKTWIQMGAVIKNLASSSQTDCWSGMGS